VHYCSLRLHCYLIILATSQVNSYFVVGKLLLLLINFFLLLINSSYLLVGFIVVLLGFLNFWSTLLVALLVVVWFFLLCWLHFERIFFFNGIIMVISHSIIRSFKFTKVVVNIIALATQFLQFLSCIGHLQLIVFICCECYWTSCKSCKSCNSLYVWCNSLQFNYNFLTTILFQLLCNSLMTTIIMSCWHHYSSIHQNLTCGTMRTFCDFFWNIDIRCPLWLFIFYGLGLWHVAQSKVATCHI